MPTINRPLAGGSLRFRIDDEVARVTETGLPSRQGRSARTLVKDGPLRVTLIVLGAGESIPEHHADGPITIAPVSGEIELTTPDGTEPLGPGDLMALSAGIRHSVESSTGAAFLLTIAAPAEREER